MTQTGDSDTLKLRCAVTNAAATATVLVDNILVLRLGQTQPGS